MRNDRQKAENWRRKGKSYKDISHKLGIPLSTLSGWFKDQEWSADIKRALTASRSFEKKEHASHAARVRWQNNKLAHRLEAQKKFKTLNKDPLFGVGLLLYWCLGEKKAQSSLVQLRSSDPTIIRFFYSFLVKNIACPPEKIHFRLWTYSDLLAGTQENFWHQATGIPLIQFRKSLVLKTKARKRRAHGTGAIFINSRALKEKMLVWLKTYQEGLPI